MKKLSGNMTPLKTMLKNRKSGNTGPKTLGDRIRRCPEMKGLSPKTLGAECGWDSDPSVEARISR